eukprot:161042-Rhodomonas_salina.2
MRGMAIGREGQDPRCLLVRRELAVEGCFNSTHYGTTTTTTSEVRLLWRPLVRPLAVLVLVLLAGVTVLAPCTPRAPQTGTHRHTETERERDAHRQSVYADGEHVSC